MGITTAFNKDSWQETATRILVEFLRDTNCFGNGASAIANVVPYIRLDKETIPIPRVELQIINVNNVSTGAGRNNSEAVFRNVAVELIFKLSKDLDTQPAQADLDLVQTCDILDKYFRSSVGFSELGKAGLRRASLNGPFEMQDKYFYIKRMLLTFEILVA